MAENYYGTGRRKTSVARVTIQDGTGNFTFNGKEINQYFPSPLMRMTVEKPFKVVNLEAKFDVVVNVQGSGLSAQADAVSLGISRALVEVLEDNKVALKEEGLMTRDPRMVERKKPGQPKARKKFQFSKR